MSLRLYQAEHLLRDYGFRFDELAFEPDGNLSLDHDPKTAWALAHPEHFPLEVTRAPRELLVRVPAGSSPCAAAAWRPAPPAFQLRLFAHGQHLTQAPYATPVPPCAYR